MEMDAALVKAVGYAAAALSTLSFLPQVVKSLRTRRLEDINLLFLLMLMAGLVLWTVYGFLLGQWPLIAANAVTLALNSVLLWLKITLGRK